MLANLVYETSTSTGTGNFTLSSTTGWVSFNTAFGTGGTDAFYYFIRHQNADEWEVGTGHLSASTTLVRDTVLASSNSDAAVSFSAGDKEVTNDLPADFQGLLAKGGNVLAPHEGLVVKYVTASTVDIDADAVTVFNGSAYKRLTSVNLTIDITASGANGLDTGSETSSTWYHLFVLWNGTTTIGVASLSATAPTKPSGYTHQAYVGAVYNDSGSNFVTFFQRGNFVSSKPTTVLTNGTQTNFTAIDLSAVVPTTATAAVINPFLNTSSGTAVITLTLAPAGSGTSTTYGNLAVAASVTTAYWTLGMLLIPMETAQQIVYRVAGSNGQGTANCNGWVY